MVMNYNIPIGKPTQDKITIIKNLDLNIKIILVDNL